MDSRITITVPATLRRELKVRAAKNDRSFSGEIVHCLKEAVGWSDHPYENKEADARA